MEHLGKDATAPHPADAGYLADLSADEIDRRFQAALREIRGQRMANVEPELRTTGSSLSQTHGLPRWFKS